MIIGIIGLGKMGNAVAYRLIQAGHTVFGFDFNEQICNEAGDIGVIITDDIAGLARKVTVAWLLVPAGDPVENVLKTLLEHMKAGAIIVDGGNSYFVDSQRRAKLCANHGISFVDCGTSGGLRGRQEGFSLMVGGDKAAYTKLHEALVAIAATNGVGYVGPSGAGHYVKMVHNGIEYGIMQAYAEGLHLIKEGSFKDNHLDLEEVTRIWMHGSVIRSWLLELTHDIVCRDQELTAISGQVEESGMGKWTSQDAQKHNIPLPVIDESLKVRAWSRETGGNYATKIVSLLRNAFGGHLFKKVDIK